MAADSGVDAQRNSQISPILMKDEVNGKVPANSLLMFGDNQNLSGSQMGAGPLNDINSTLNATHNRLREIVLPMLYSLLSSKESESKAGGLNILGSFCGLSYDFTGVKIHKNLAFL